LKLEFTNIPILSFVLQKLGEASYSLYLLHPIIWLAIDSGNQLNPLAKILICIAISLAGSFTVFYSFERPFMTLGRKFGKVLLGNAFLRERLNII
jgi:exopolysaccharide production protein ExoZ